ncbi:MAG: mechanosensitive ion channel family protein [Clostridia bacterium]|nr:mechanosensitive ion channel family protein [Clostridia bacterium]MBR7062432.1 mechanosensitive ion channel family protein [Clostridia bacterium]
MDKFIEKLINMGTSYGGKLVLAIVTLIVGLLVIKLIGKLIKKALGNSKLNDTVKLVIIKTVKIILYVVLIVGIVSILGVPMSSVVAIIASCGLAVGLAFQGALANLAGGLMILIFHPFKVGDYVQATGAEGVVTDISIFYTKLLTLDNKRVLVPNGDLMNANITNLTAEDKRRIDQDFKITNDIDQDLVRSVLMAAAKATEGVMEDPAPFARLTAVDDDTYIFTVRAWCDTAKYWDVYFDLIENCSSALAANGIDDPEERIAVRLVKDEDDNEKAAE